MAFRTPIRLIIADDHAIYRNALKSFIPQKDASINIVGQAASGEELIKEVQMKKPDIVLTDIQMANMSGCEACDIINKRFPCTSVIALSMYNDPQIIYKMFEKGAKGYLTKNSELDEVVEAINTVYSGELYYCSTSSMSLIKKIGPSRYNQYIKNREVDFTPKEIELMRYICIQLTTKEIADKMKISSRTVEEYSHNIKEKIEAKNLVGIALYAVKNHLVNLNEIGI